MQDAVKALRIEPEHIRIDYGLCSTFGKTEREALAEVLVHFCQVRASFEDFRRSDLEYWLYAQGGNAYLTPWTPEDPASIIAEAEAHGWLEYDDNGRWSFDVGFIRKCYLAAKRNFIYAKRLTARRAKVIRIR